MFNQIKKKLKLSKEETKKEVAINQELYTSTIDKQDIRKVSVVLPNYNYEAFLEERIASIFQQTYPIEEVLILDDHSTDGSLDLIHRLVKQYEQTGVSIRVIENEVNSGRVFKQWRKGFEEAKGEYIWIAEADDDCSPFFLEKLMQGMKDPNVVLAYAESMRIDEEHAILRKDCRDWTRMIDEKRWNQDYIKNGIEEIKEALSITNTIPNVSAVVFKKFDASMMEEIEQQFILSGDWYLYLKRLQEGDIFYCSESLNYFRKHRGSVSTDVKKDIELKEMFIIQKEIADTLHLDEQQRNRQRRRYRDILLDVSEETKQEVFKPIQKKIAWIVPEFTKGGGGARTILQNANYLATHGWLSDLYVDGAKGSDATSITLSLQENFEECFCNVYLGCQLRHEYDAIIATYSIHTPEIAYFSNVSHKFYFVQDFEPWFEAMGDAYLQRERGYTYGLQGISIGNWLRYRLHKEYQMPMGSFPFCADVNIYKRLAHVPKEKAICFIYQPEKPRRCSQLGLDALHIVKRLHPEVTIYVYGSQQACAPGFDVVDLQLLSVSECNELYNRCSVGLCISASNPSRVPFEMMAAGLPVVDIYRENNLYDYPNEGILLADHGADALATALLMLLQEDTLQANMSFAGETFMKQYPIEKGFEDFLSFMNAAMQDEEVLHRPCEPTYKREAIKASEETSSCLQQLYEEEANKEYLSIQILDDDLGSFELRVKGLADAKNLVSVRVPVWCDPNQGDIVWYELQRQEHDEFSIIGGIDQHQQHRGTYQAHVYTYLDVEHGVCVEQQTFHIA